MIAHPSVAMLADSFSRADLFLVVYCLVHDWMKQRYGASNAPRSRRGPRDDEFSDAELLTVVLVGEVCHCSRERAWLRQVRASHKDLFPALPEDSRFAKRAKQARHLLTAFRDAILFWADADLDNHRLLDSYPLPLCACYRIHQSNQPVEGSAFGRCASKRAFFFGLRPQLLSTFSLYLVDLCLAPGNCTDVKALALYLDECQEQGRNLAGQVWAADKGYVSRALAEAAQRLLGLTLLVRERDRKGEDPSAWQEQIEALRRPIEKVISLLSTCFHLENILATTGIGLYRRCQAKITAFNLARYFNHVLGREALDIARYAV